MFYMNPGIILLEYIKLNYMNYNYGCKPGFGYMIIKYPEEFRQRSQSDRLYATPVVHNWRGFYTDRTFNPNNTVINRILVDKLYFSSLRFNLYIHSTSTRALLESNTEHDTLYKTLDIQDTSYRKLKKVINNFGKIEVKTQTTAVIYIMRVSTE